MSSYSRTISANSTDHIEAINTVSGSNVIDADFKIGLRQNLNGYESCWLGGTRANQYDKVTNDANKVTLFSTGSSPRINSYTNSNEIRIVDYSWSTELIEYGAEFGSDTSLYSVIESMGNSIKTISLYVGISYASFDSEITVTFGNEEIVLDNITDSTLRRVSFTTESGNFLRVSLKSKITQLIIKDIQVEYGNKMTEYIPYSNICDLSNLSYSTIWSKRYIMYGSKNLLKLSEDTYYSSQNCDFSYGSNNITIDGLNKNADVVFKTTLMTSQYYTVTFKASSTISDSRIYIGTVEDGIPKTNNSTYLSFNIEPGLKTYTGTFFLRRWYNTGSNEDVWATDIGITFKAIRNTSSSPTSGTLTVTDLQIDFGKEPTAFEPSVTSPVIIKKNFPTYSESYPIFYGGVFKLDGTLINSYYIKTLSDISDYILYSSDGQYFYALKEDIDGYIGKSKRLYSNSYKCFDYDTGSNYICWQTDTMICIRDTRYATVSDFLDALGDVQIAYQKLTDDVLSNPSGAFDITLSSGTNIIVYDTYIDGYGRTDEDNTVYKCNCGISLTYLANDNNIHGKYLIQADTIIGITDKLREKLNTTTPIEVTSIPNEILKLKKPLPAAEEASF